MVNNTVLWTVHAFSVLSLSYIWWKIIYHLDFCRLHRDPVIRVCLFVINWKLWHKQEERLRQERIKEEEARRKEAERKKKEEEARSEELRRQEEERRQVSWYCQHSVSFGRTRVCVLVCEPRTVTELVVFSNQLILNGVVACYRWFAYHEYIMLMVFQIYLARELVTLL